MKALTVIQDMLTDHQRMNPHYEPVCTVCQQAQEALAAAGAENEKAIVIVGGDEMMEHAQILARHFGKHQVFNGSGPAVCDLPPDSILLTRHRVSGAIPFNIALAAAIHR